jgi:hypothetical protein
MSKVQVFYEGKKNVKLVSNSFDSEEEATRFKTLMEFIFLKLEKMKVSSAKKFQVSMISPKSNSNSKQNNKSKPLPQIESGTFSDMIVENYSKGYLLRPKDQHPDWGKKYYHDGWWNTNQEAWFFKKEKLGDLLFQGAELQETALKNTKKTVKKTVKKIKFETPETKDKNTCSKNKQSNPTVKRYSKRIYKKNNPQITVEKNIISDMSSKITVEKNIISDMSLEPYGKGYLLRPSVQHPDWGQKYYHDGWWNTNQEAWFFKKENLPSFCKNMEC